MKRIISSLVTVTFAGMMTLAASAQTGTQSGQDPQDPNHSMSNTKTSAAGTTMADDTFMKKAAAGGLAEVELGQLATQKASSDQVKQFGQRMVDDHSKTNDQLKQIAEQEHVKLPTQPSAKARAVKAQLEKLSGSEFDQAYMKDMVKDHRRDVAEFEKESKNANDPALKNFAEQTLPTLREHLNQAQQIALPAEKTQASNPGNSMR
jgi:putative membrane protein